MSAARSKLEETRLRELAREYKRQGYRVTLEPEPKELPRQLRGFQPDLIATSDEESVVVEVKSRQTLAESTEILGLARVVRDMPSWRFDLIMTNPKDAETLVEARPPQPELVRQRADNVASLLDTGNLEAALLLAWSAMEGAVRTLGSELVPDSSSRPISYLLRALYSQGNISQRQFEFLDSLEDVRNAISHGLPVDLPTAVEVARLSRLAVDLLDPDRASVQDMVDWFFDSYEDPAHHVPFEGEYVYYAGGPYNALEELQEQFPNANEEDLQEASEVIESQGFDWVKSGQYP